MLSTITWCRSVKAGAIPLDLVTIPGGRYVVNNNMVSFYQGGGHPTEGSCDHSRGKVCCQQLHGVILSRRGSSHWIV